MARCTTHHRFLAVRAVEHEPSKGVAELRPVADLRFQPTERGAREIQRLGLVFKPAIGGFDLFYRACPLEADELLPEISERVRFTFMMLGGRSLSRFDVGPDGGGPGFYFDNLTARGSIRLTDDSSLAVRATVGSEDRAYLRPPRFDLYATRTPRQRAPTRFVFRPRFGSQPEQRIDASPGTGRETATRIELPAEPTAWTLTTGRSRSRGRTVYVDAGLRRAGAIGVVELFWDRRQSAVPRDTGLTYRIAFRRAA